MKNRRCLNLACPLRGKVSSGNIVRRGFYRTRSGKRRRYRCGECGKTFSSTKGTPYYRLQHRRATFDGVIALRVEGVSISSTSRIKGIAWNTVARWLEKAAQVCRRFNHRRIAGFAAEELQADEIRTFAGNKKTPSWVCLLFIHPPVHGSEVSPAARNTLDSARIPRASKLLICGLFLKGRVLAQDGVGASAIKCW